MRNFIAAIKRQTPTYEPHRDKFEHWDLTDVEQQVLARPDEEIIWATDTATLALELNQRLGANESYSFAIQDEHHYQVITSKLPIWSGQVSVADLVKCLEKFGGAIIERPPLRLNGKGQSESNPTRQKGQEILRKLRNHPAWENYELKEVYTGSFAGALINYKPGAGEIRRRDAEQLKQYKKQNAKREKELKKYSVELTKYRIEDLVKALHTKLYSALPKNVRPEVNLRGRKDELAKRALFYYAMLTLHENPHHKHCPRALRKAMVSVAPYVAELPEKAAPYNKLGKILLKELEVFNIDPAKVPKKEAKVIENGSAT